LSDLELFGEYFKKNGQAYSAYSQIKVNQGLSVEKKMIVYKNLLRKYLNISKDSLFVKMFKRWQR